MNKAEYDHDVKNYADRSSSASVDRILQARGAPHMKDERGGDTRRKFWIKPLKETDPGVAQAFFDP